MVNDPALVDGTLDPAERVAVRMGPLISVGLRPAGTVAAVAAVGATGTLLATDRRMLLLLDDGAVAAEWAWRDVAEVRFIPSGAGVTLLPTRERFEQGVRVEGVVEPWFARGEPPPPEPKVATVLGLWKVEGAWRSGQPGGLAAWREELTAHFGM